MAYTKQTWNDLPNTTTPVTATRLNHIEDGVYDAHNLQNSAIMVKIKENKTFSNVSAWVIYNIPFDTVVYNVGDKFSLNTSTGEVTYSGNKKLKITTGIRKDDSSTVATIYPNSTGFAYTQEAATASYQYAHCIVLSSSSSIYGRVLGATSGNIVLTGNANNIYTYMIVEEI